MTFRLVTCPETAHLELLEYEDDSLGMLIQRCSRFGHGDPTCDRICAARLDLKKRRLEQRADGCCCDVDSLDEETVTLLNLRSK